MDLNRKLEILDKALGYISEHSTTEEEEYSAFKNIIGLSNDEMEELGFWFEKSYKELEEECERD